MKSRPLSLQAILIVAVTLIALFLNGATAPGARQLVLLLMAAATIAAPLDQRPGKWLSFLTITVLAASFTAFLPASLFPIPAWRATATREIGIQLPATVSPQPWLSAEAICLLAAGLAWLCFLTCKHWTRRERSRVCRTLAAASILLGAAYLALHTTATRWPTAAIPDQFGPFPNKNQTASVLLLGGIVTAGLINLPGGNRRSEKLLWGAGLVILIAALAAVGSRTALVLFTIAALGLSVRRATMPAIAFAASALLLSITGLILSNADILKKFSGEVGVLATASENGRWPLYADSLHMLQESPVTGTGIGNFEEVFALHRKASAAPNRALHPDSDLIWAASEIGFPATLLLTALVLSIFALTLPLKQNPSSDSRRDHALRIACLVAAAAFACHSLLDVPAHRLGALLPATLLLALAIHPRRKNHSATRANRIALATVAAVPALAISLIPSTPSPLDANAHFTSAQEHLSRGELSMASAEFEMARFLRPDNAELTLDEGRLLLPHSPQHAIAAWREALQRARNHGRAGEYYHQILSLARNHPDLHEDLWLLADAKPDLQLIAITASDEAQNREHLQRIFAENPDLKNWNHQQIAQALHLFSRYNSPDELIETVTRHPDWASLCWRPLSQAYSNRGDHTRAFQVISAACPPPDLSILRHPIAIDSLRSEHLRSPHKLTPAIRLAYQHMRRGNHDRALEILRAFSSPDQQSPPIVHFMIALTLAQQSHYDQAREALLTYADMIE